MTAPERVVASATTDAEDAEAAELRRRYARRPSRDPRYSPTQPATLMAAQERQRALRTLFARAGLSDLSGVSLLEVGSGSGGNLLELLWFGFMPEHLSGIELLEERHRAARARLPAGVALRLGDATEADIAPASVDIVYASTVFSSLLDDAYQARLAAAMWAALRPGGAVLWYDFVVGNPRNPDVRGVPVARLRALFPEADVTTRRVTLAPPLARHVCRLHPALYTCFNALPLLRTHVLAWASKPHQTASP